MLMKQSSLRKMRLHLIQNVFMGRHDIEQNAKKPSVAKAHQSSKNIYSAVCHSDEYRGAIIFVNIALLYVLL